MANSDLTILVKKADGTFERKKLSELSSVKKIITPVAPAMPIKKETKPVVKITPPVKILPVKPAAKPEVKGPVFKKENFVSPLEDKLPARTDGTPATPANRAQEADEVLKKIKFFISPDNIARLRGLIQLRLKDIRSEKEFLEELAAPVGNKGMGLDGRQAGEILRLCQEALARVVKETPVAVKPLKGKVGLPMVEEPEIPATATPFNAFKHEPPKKEEKVFKIRPEQPRPIMQDVIAKNTSVGPIEEIRMFNLVDFRRLSVDPPEAAARFKQKLENLKAESYLLYMEALNAWRESPFYLAYLEAINNSLKTGKSLVAALPEKDKIQFSEIKAIVEMEKSL